MTFRLTLTVNDTDAPGHICDTTTRADAVTTIAALTRDHTRHGARRLVRPDLADTRDRYQGGWVDPDGRRVVLTATRTTEPTQEHAA